MKNHEKPARDSALRTAFRHHKVPGEDANADGCVILGSTAPTGYKYTTRYRIDHAKQRKKMSKMVMHEECVPCCQQENRISAKSCIWNFVKAEAFLFSMHITALILGVVKEAMDIRELSEHMELAYSVVETLVAMLMVIIRVIIAWYSYKEVKQTAFQCEIIVGEKKALRGKAIKRWRDTVMVIGCLLLIYQVACFTVFYFLIHLGWTILSNNFAMVVISVISGLYMTRTAKISATIRGDQHKAVLYESVLLLQESYYVGTPSQKKDFYANVRRFTKAMAETEFLEKPEHISLSEQNTLKMDMLTAMEMQSMV